MKRISSSSSDFDCQLNDLLKRNSVADKEIERVVQDIIQQVRTQGDRALLDLTCQFDHLDITFADQLEIPVARLQSALEKIDANLRQALELAADRIKCYHEKEINQSWRYSEEDGTVLGQQITPLERVGVYVPGGKASYPSTVLMTVIPAKVAGVKEVIMVVPAPGGEISESVLAAASLTGVDRIFTIGGAQAVAALAYGTESVPIVDKIVGPGNIFVATAKKQVFGQVGIDMIAGPSEVVVICDRKADPDWVAIDLFAQSEHDELAQSIAITDSKEMADSIHVSINKLLPQMERRQIIEEALNRQGAIICVDSLEQAAEISNRIAPEHLELMVDDGESLLKHIRNAGAIFVGGYSAESLGDYCAGPNHVLPTAGTARFSSPLGVYDFQKRSSLIHCSVAGGGKMASIAAILAKSEGLGAHARSAELRLTTTD